MAFKLSDKYPPLFSTVFMVFKDKKGVGYMDKDDGSTWINFCCIDSNGSSDSYDIESKDFDKIIWSPEI